MDRPAPPPFQQAVHELDGKPGTVAAARDLARAFLDHCHPALDREQYGDALLLVSELVSNAVRHAAGPCTLTLTDSSAGLGIALRDGSPVLPVPRVPDPVAGGGGFGWHLLERLSGDLNVRPHPGGKTVSLTIPPRGGG